jgi:maleate isomerase
MPLSAAVAAFRALSTSRISLAAPYTEEILEGVRRYLEKQRSMCCKCKRVGLSDNYTIVEQPPQTIYQLASSANLKGGGGVFISCTNLRVLNTIEELERYLGKVVISSNQAALWAA